MNGEPRTMSTHKMLMTGCCAAVLTFGLAACSGGGDGDETPQASAPTMPGEGPAPVLNQLETAQAGAADAATAAMTAASNAMTAATDADTAGANAATMQTGDTSSGLAAKAADQARLAHTAYMAAKAASEAAAAATDVTTAVRAQVAAEIALANAMAAETKAGEYGQMAMDAAVNELKIVDKTKTVGGTSLTIDGTASSQTINDVTVVTGLMEDDNPKHPVLEVTGIAGDADATPSPIAYRQAVAAAPGIEIGFLYDSSDDNARLMLVTSYAGTKMVKVYHEGGDTETGTKAGYITIPDTETTEEDVNNVRLKSEGIYYPAGDGEGGSGEGALDQDEMVAADAKGKEVFSYTDVANDDNKKYVVATTTVMGDEPTMYNYVNVDVMVDHDGDAGTAETEVMAGIPEKTAYEHIHFGVWAALGAAVKETGVQELADLGIGFVQNYSDSGVTGADMPNHGTADYDGDWAASVQAEDPDGNGKISLKFGAASMAANFGMGKVTATLTDLAVLEGDIAGSAFSGDKATIHDTIATTDAIDNTSGLATDGKFTGSFSGAFYGAKAAEAGGVFDFASEDNEDGAFRGAFGGVR